MSELPGRAVVGGQVTVGVTVENPTPAERPLRVELAVDGERRLVREVAVQAGTRRSVSLALAFETPGVYRVAVNGEVVGRVTVVADANPITEPGLTPAGNDVEATAAPGFGAGVAVAALVVGLLVLYGRR